MAAQYEQPQGWLGKVQDFFNKANNVSVPVTPYTKAALDGTTQNPVSDFIDRTVGRPFVNISNDYQQAGGGAQGVGAALRGDLDRTVDWTLKNVINPSYSDTTQAFKPYVDLVRPIVSGVISGFSKGPEQAARDFQAAQAENHSDAAVEAAPGAYPKVKPDTTEDGSSRLAALKVAHSAAAIPTPPSANPYALNAAALPVVPTYNDVSVDDARNSADMVNEFLAKQRTNEPTKESMQALMAPNSFGMYPKGAGPTPEDSFTKHATISMLGSPSEQQQQQVGDLVKQGYKEVNNIQSAPGDYAGTPFYRKTTDITADQLQKSDPARYKALMELQALREADAAGQAKKYQQTGLTPPPIVTKDKFGAPVQTIMQPNAPATGKSLNPNAPKPFDMSNMEEYKVEIPGKGWMTGLRQKDPNRQQGTLSITPGLSDSERAQVDQINANQARQAAYGVSRKTGELYDASLQHQQQQAALQALKQLQMQQEQAYQNKRLSLDERKALAAENQNAMTNEYNAGKLAIDRGNMLTQGNRYAQQSAHDRANRQDSFMKDHFRKWATESPAGLKSKNPWDDFAVTNLGVLSASARTNDPPKFATPYASKTAGMIDVVYPDGKVRTVPYIDYIDALSQPAQTAEEN